MQDLHGVFGVTIYGDKVRVSHYGAWDEAQVRWDLLDQMLRLGYYHLLKYVCVRAWDDPQWNTARYRSLDTVYDEGENDAANAS